MVVVNERLLQFIDCFSGIKGDASKYICYDERAESYKLLGKSEKVKKNLGDNSSFF